MQPICNANKQIFFFWHSLCFPNDTMDVHDIYWFINTWQCISILWCSGQCLRELVQEKKTTVSLKRSHLSWINSSTRFLFCCSTLLVYVSSSSPSSHSETKRRFLNWRYECNSSSWISASLILVARINHSASSALLRRSFSIYISIELESVPLIMNVIIVVTFKLR